VNRFDLHPIVRNAINEAVRLRVIDAVGAWELGIEHGGNGTAILESLTDISFNDRHSPSGRKKHAAMCELNDAYHAELAKSAS